jgi:xanthine dehydrogenase/oxidase
VTAPLHTPGHQLVFAVNGELRVIEHPDPTLLLVDYLRSAEVGLTSTKLACGEGGCGACTVTLTTWDEATDTLTSRPVNSCLRPICLLDGQAITTTEGIGNVRDGVHPVQYEIAACNGSQCGFCTPGFVMNMFAGLQAGKPLTAREIENRFDAHICRCTGFRPILQAMRTFAADAADTYPTDARDAPERPRPAVLPVAVTLVAGLLLCRALRGRTLAEAVATARHPSAQTDRRNG